MTGRRVVVTGLGPVTSLGVGAKAFHAGQLEGRGAVRPISRFDASDLPVRIAAEVDLPDELRLARRDFIATDRVTHLAAAAASLALADAGLDLDAADRNRIGVVLGTGCGGAESIRHNGTALARKGPGGVGARFIPMSMSNSSASWIAIRYGLGGPVTTTVTACASGADALLTAHQMIVTGEADVVLAGGTEAPVTDLVVSGFAKMKALSTRNEEPERASRPFGADRTGFVLGEGAAVLVLEDADHARARGAEPLAALLGYGRTCDAYHVVAPRPDGAAAARAVTGALRSAGLAPEEVSHVNAHGTGTVLNDAAEAAALTTALGPVAARIPVTATKSMTGHTLGAAGAIEAVAAVQTLVHQVVPPTANLDAPDLALGLDLVAGEPLDTRVSAVLSNSFAFGGHNVVLAFGRP
ncbi:beta-ketoacyl synthase [Streptomyces sp. NBC_00878]|uniref:beta-ketoacyl-[acyl-carrier-protein] synthase family protein n=1 Tax=Streptomyces sp. NBC_00878 TaxID=2975854 RepID=UPI0022582ED8|nr:beta-ketoacyl-[acyl-carrier-protein] synthase family protein [Streptomyces sp. NBC_00878]MCX4904258.1 beta-ketoacyl-[acyl-carrier-protein] synthase family protein [Streptomyces sp. NBC_00878]